MKRFIYGLFFAAGILSIGLLQSCKNKEPSVLKVFVRSGANLLQSNARVVIIADVQENDSQIEYVDTLFTNAEGFIEFNIADYFSEAGKDIETANFDIIAKGGDQKLGYGNVRCRVHTTAVGTIFLED